MNVRKTQEIEVWSQDATGTWILMATFNGDVSAERVKASTLFGMLARVAPDRVHEIRQIEKTTRTTDTHRPAGKRRS